MRGKRERTQYPGIYRLGSTKFEVHVSLGRNPITGKYQKRNEVVDGKIADARNRQAEMAKEVANQTAPISGWTMNKLATEYFRHIELTAAPGSLSSDKNRWDLMSVGIGDRSVRSVTAYDIDRLLDGLMTTRGVKPQTINRYRAVLSSMFRTAVGWQVVSTNPLTQVKIRTATHVRRSAIDGVTVAGVMTTVAKVDPELCRILELTALLGCRRSETCGLQRGDWDANRDQITIQRGVKVPQGGGYKLGDSKAHNIRQFKPEARAILIIKEQLANLSATGPTAFLFSPNDGVDPYLPASVSQRFDRLKDKMCPKCFDLFSEPRCESCDVEIGIKLTMHNLRRFNTTTRLRAGVNPAYVQYTGGWKDMKVMLSHYADFHTDDADESNAALSAAFGR